jgi:hypothetical protein
VVCFLRHLNNVIHSLALYSLWYERVGGLALYSPWYEDVGEADEGVGEGVGERE